MYIPTVAFIDDGIHKTIVPQCVSYNSLVMDEGVVYENQSIGHLAHGAECYRVFQDFVNVPYRLISLKVMDHESQTGNCINLAKALEWCNISGVDLINLSIGTRQCSDLNLLYRVAARLAEKNVIIVAACSNNNTLTYPACFPMVIGVRYHTDLELGSSIVYIDEPYDQIETMAFSTSLSNSFAAPVISAKVCEYISAGCNGLDAIRGKLRHDAMKYGSKNQKFSQGFYRELLTEWRNINVPVVAFPMKSSSKTSFSTEKPNCRLMSFFADEGYHAVCFSETQFTDIRRNIFSLSLFRDTEVNLYDRTELLYNFVQPDIIFLDISVQSTRSLNTTGCIDITLEEFQVDDVPCIYRWLVNTLN